MATPQLQIQQLQQPPAIRENGERAGESFDARVLRTIGEYYDLTKSGRARRYYLWSQAELFSKGIHYTLYDPFQGKFTEWSQEQVAKCMYTPFPLVQFAVELIASQYQISDAKVVPVPRDEQDQKARTVAKTLQDYADHFDFEFYRRNAQERQIEARMIPLRGVYSFLEYDREAGPAVQATSYADQSGMMCQDCGAAAGPAQCPQCGSQNIAPVTTGVQPEQQSGRQGQARRHIVDPFQVEIFDRRRSVEESPYLFYDEIMFRAEAFRDYPWLKKIQGSASLGSYEKGFVGLHYLLQIQTLIANTGRLDQSQDEYGVGSTYSTLGYQGAFLNELLCWRRRVWLDVDTVADWTFPKDRPTQLPGVAEPVPPGTPVSEVFPEGPVVHLLNGDTIVQYENQNKNDVWSYCPYRVPSSGLYGSGVSSLISLNRGYDEVNSYAMQGLLMAALGIILVDERVPKVENVPGRVVRIPQDARLPNESLDSMATRLDMGGAAAIAAAEPIKETLRGTIGDLSMTANPQGYGNRPQGVGGETATAIRYNAGATSTLISPPLELYAAHRARVIEQAVNLERKNNIRPRLFGKFGETAAKWLEPMDLPEDIAMGVVQESWRPRNQEVQREDLGAAVSLGVGSGKLQPAIEDKAIRVFGLDEDVSDYEDWSVLGEKRLDAIRAASQAIEQQGGQGPEAVQLAIMAADAAPKMLDNSGHQHLARFYEEVYLSDRWESLGPLGQEAVAQVWLLHQQGVGQAAALQTQQQIIAQAPAMEAAQAQQEQQGQQQFEREGAVRAEEREADETKRAEERETSSRERAEDHERKVELETLKGQQKAKGK